jgi:hypothetical protein
MKPKTAKKTGRKRNATGGPCPRLPENPNKKIEAIIPNQNNGNILLWKKVLFDESRFIRFLNTFYRPNDQQLKSIIQLIVKMASREVIAGTATHIRNSFIVFVSLQNYIISGAFHKAS